MIYEELYRRAKQTHTHTREYKRQAQLLKRLRASAVVTPFKVTQGH